MTDTKFSFIALENLIKNKEVLEASTRVEQLLSLDDNIDGVLKKHFVIKNPDGVAEMSESTFSDMQLDIWCSQQGHSRGGRDLIYQMLSAPTTDIELLKKRQKSIQKTDIKWQDEIRNLALLERDVLWIYTLPKDFKDMWPIPLFFPTFPIFNRINRSSQALFLYHTYRIWLTPFLQLFIPTISILGPWLYLRYKMKWQISIGEYFQLIRFLFLQNMAGADWKQQVSRYGTIIMYIMMFLYGFVQTIDVSRMLYIVKKRMMERITKIKDFIDRSYDLLSGWNITDIQKPIVPNGMAGVYAIWTDNMLRNNIKKLIQRFYELDVSMCCKLLVMKEKWCFAKYTNNTLCKKLRNPLLGKEQISNPMCLLKNIIITGPNAAGKSTYVRSIGANIICSQALGICCSKTAKIKPVNAILSYMRIRDLVGEKSLFETEIEHCSNILNTATKIEKSGKSALIFFDEPMHSTPALEGEAAAYAVLEHLGNMNNIRTVVTSHYHRLTTLGSSEKSTQWTNLCMDAVYYKKTETYSFPYSIRHGVSFQSIALELLRGKEHLPASIVQNAIKFKSSINKQ